MTDATVTTAIATLESWLRYIPKREVEEAPEEESQLNMLAAIERAIAKGGPTQIPVVLYSVSTEEDLDEATYTVSYGSTEKDS
jgi:hypothetical protein